MATAWATATFPRAGEGQVRVLIFGRSVMFWVLLEAYTLFSARSKPSPVRGKVAAGRLTEARLTDEAISGP